MRHPVRRHTPIAGAPYGDLRCGDFAHGFLRARCEACDHDLVAFSHRCPCVSGCSRSRSIPREYIPSCDKGFKECIKKGTLIGFPVVGVRGGMNDGAAHAVDSSEIAFKTAALMGFREAYEKAGPIVTSRPTSCDVD